MKRIAVVGDPHGCIKEFDRLVKKLEWISLDEIWTVGDLCDRGPSSAGVIDVCINKGIKSVMGNHDQSILNHKRISTESKRQTRNQDKRDTLAQLEQRHFDYLEKLPYLAVDDDLGLIITHAGVWPKIPLYKQPTNVCRAQMILPDQPGKVRWWGVDASFAEEGYNITEEQSKSEGYERWYKLYDYEEDIIFGHSTWAQPMIYQSPYGGKCIGVDMGSCFGGSVTACVYDSNKEFFFMSVKAEKVYYKDTKRSFWEG